MMTTTPPILDLLAGFWPGRTTFLRGYMGIMDKKMETAGIIGVIEVI